MLSDPHRQRDSSSSIPGTREQDIAYWNEMQMPLFDLPTGSIIVAGRIGWHSPFRNPRVRVIAAEKGDRCVCLGAKWKVG